MTVEFPKAPSLSVVSTTFNSEATLRTFVTRTLEASRLAGFQETEIQVVLVDDGSTDGTPTVVAEIVADNEFIEALILSRNFGHHEALLAGLAHARGDLVFMLDSDMEEDPAWLLPMLAALDSEADYVVAVQSSRKGGLAERWFGATAYRVMKVLTSVQIPRNVSTARLMRRPVVSALLMFKDQPVVIGGFQHLAGFRGKELLVTKGSKGSTTYTLPKRLRLLLSILVGYSTAPLLLATAVGALGVVAAALSLLYLMVSVITKGTPPSGFAAIFVSVWALGGLTLFLLGTITVYLHQLLRLTRGRPRTLVNRHLIGGE